MLKVLLPAAAALLLTAFAARPAPVDPAPVMAWRVGHEGALAKLSYGAENSDQLAIMITCAPGDRTAVVYGAAYPAAARPTTSPTPAPLDPLSGGDAVETRLPLTDPDLTGLASRGALQVHDAEGRYVLSADRAERRLIAGFLSYCATARA